MACIFLALNFSPHPFLYEKNRRCLFVRKGNGCGNITETYQVKAPLKADGPFVSIPWGPHPLPVTVVNEGLGWDPLITRNVIRW